MSCHMRAPIKVSVSLSMWRFPKIRGTILGGPHNKDYSVLGSV